MKITKEFKKTSLLRRIAAAAIDLIVALILFILFEAFVLNPCFYNFTEYGEKYQTYLNLLDNSKLYIVDSYGNIDDIATENYVHKEERISYFYDTYAPEEKEYFENEKGKRTDLFTYQNGEYVFKENASDAELEVFYNLQYLHAINILENFDEMQELTMVLGAYHLGMVFLGLFLGLSLTLYLPPLFFKDGQTLGKKIFYIRIISKKGDGKITWVQSLIRTSIYFIAELLLSIYSFGIPLLVNMCVTIFHPEHMGIHDILCSTVAIDTSFYDPTKLREKDKFVISYETQKEEEKKDE